MRDEAGPPGKGGSPGVEDEAGELFVAAVDASPTAMLITDPRQPDNPIIFANAAACALTGYPLEELVGRNCRLLQGPGTDRATVAEIREALRAGRGIDCVILNYRRDGTPFRHRLVIRPVRDGSGALVRFVSSQVELAEGPAEELRRLDALLHEVDHRAKNNLQVVASLILLKARRAADPATQAALQSMAERVAALATAHRLLVPSGGASVLALDELVRELADDILPADGRIGFSAAVGPIPLASAQGAPVALILAELLTNAVRHGFPDQRRGRIRVAADREGDTLRLAVEDDGVGLPDEPPAEATFGRTVLDLLVRQLRGGLAMEGLTGGTRAVLTFPLASGS
jgi:PAS domain S-box-containing protein